MHEHQHTEFTQRQKKYRNIKKTTQSTQEKRSNLNPDVKKNLKKDQDFNCSCNNLKFGSVIRALCQKTYP